MSFYNTRRSLGSWIMIFTAIIFGLLTLKSGGSVLFIDGIARENAGNYVPFVLWFNFLAGFVYIVAGVGLFMQKNWAVWISIGLFVATAVVFFAFGLYVMDGGAYEERTVGAMGLRTVVWGGIAFFGYRGVVRG